MADYTIKSGDTWPPLPMFIWEACDENDPERYRLTLEDGSLDESRWVKRVSGLGSAEEIRMIAKLSSPATTFDGPMTVDEVENGPSEVVGEILGEEPGLGVPINRGLVSYYWNAGDTDTPGEGYELEVETTWSTETTPARIETFPNESDDNPTLDIDPDLD